MRLNTQKYTAEWDRDLTEAEIVQIIDNPDWYKPITRGQHPEIIADDNDLGLGLIHLSSWHTADELRRKRPLELAPEP